MDKNKKKNIILTHTNKSHKERVQKIISNSGYCSRKKAEELIKQKRVTVNNKFISLGDKADPLRDIIKIDNKKIKRTKKVYFCFNKPIGLICSRKDKRKTIFDYIYNKYPKMRKYNLYHVGRLDYNTRGLILLTNDGNFSNYIMHPSHNIKKTYLVKLNKKIKNEDIEKIKAGIYVSNVLFKANSTIVSNKMVKVIISYGKKRIIRKGFEALGYKINDLIRIKIGSIKLDGLKEGEIRPITKEELHKIGYIKNKII